MQHDYSIVTQRIFATVFGIFALVGPVIGVTFSDNFGLRAQISIEKKDKSAVLETKLAFHEKLFCSDWAGNCDENKVMDRVHQLIK